MIQDNVIQKNVAVSKAHRSNSSKNQADTYTHFGSDDPQSAQNLFPA